MARPVLGKTKRPPQVNQVQAKAAPGKGGSVSPRVANSIQGLRGGGTPLPKSTKAFFEPRFGQDFSKVRLHTDAKAATMADSIRAKAFTLGNDIAFAKGAYNPESKSGKQLLAHELTHTVQQGKSKIRKIQRYSTQDCSAQEKKKIAAAMKRAKEMLDHAITRLTASPVSAATKKHFANHFGAWANWRRNIVVMHLKRDRKLLKSKSLQFECEKKSSSRAYTYWIFGDIHLGPKWFNDSNLTEQAETLIHEIHHWDPLRGHLDLGYHGNKKNADTIWIVAVNNADAYSELVQDLY